MRSELSRCGLAVLGLLFLIGCQQAGPTSASPTAVQTSRVVPDSTVTATFTAVLPTNARNLPAPELFDIGWQDRSVFRAGLTPNAQPVLDASTGMSVYHLDLSINDDLMGANGKEQVLYTNTESIPLDQVDFRLYPNLLGGSLNIDNLKVNGLESEPDFALDKSLMTVTLPESLLPGDQVVFSMEFSVRVPTDTTRNYGILISTQGILAYDHGYPVIAVYNDEGWNAEIPPPWGDLSFADAAYYLVRVSAPEQVKLVASGNQISHQADYGRQIVVFAAGPARDFYLAAGRDFASTEIQDGNVTLRAFAPAAYADRVDLALRVAAHALQVYSSRYIDYPYTQLSMVVTPTSALGIEYPGLIVLNQKLFTPENDLKVTPEVTWLESTVAHEVAHQWFFNMIGNDQLDEPWLDESLAQFATWQYFRDVGGAVAATQFEDTLNGRWSRVKYQPIPIDEPVRAFDPISYSAIIYGRGALFLEQLENEIGEQTFNTFMQDYAQEELWKISTTLTFQSLAEKHCRCDLTQLFNQWVYPDGGG